MFFSTWAFLYALTALYIFIYKARGLFWKAVFCAFLIYIPLLFFDEIIGHIKVEASNFSILTMATIGARSSIEEVSRIIMLVVAIRVFYGINRRVIILNVANIIALTENIATLVPLYAAIFAFYNNNELSINFENSVQVLRAFDDKSTSIFVVALLSIMQFARLLLHFSLGYVGVTAFMAKQWWVVISVAVLHAITNITIYYIQGVLKNPMSAIALVPIIMMIAIFLCFVMNRNLLLDSACSKWQLDLSDRK